MLRRKALASTAAAAALCGVLAAGGAAAEPRQSALPAPDLDTVTLPTGDQVRLLPGGALGLAPAAGREHIGFTTLPAADGTGTIVMPSDMAGDLLAGTEDARRYNVTDLIEHGRTDAAAVAERDLSSYASLALADGEPEDPNLTVHVGDHTGAAPDGGYVAWYDVTDHDNSGTLDLDANGTATGALEPGDYLLQHAVWNYGANDAFTEYVFGIGHVTIGDEPAELVLDGAAASLVTADVERPGAEIANDVTNVVATRADGASVGHGSFGNGDTALYLMPEVDVPGYDLGFWYQPTLTGMDDAGAYQYNLAFAEPDGFPADTAYAVHDEKLAAVATEYTGFGEAVDGRTCDRGDHTREDLGADMCLYVDTPFPSERLNLYTAGPDVTWSTNTTGGVFDPESGQVIDGFTEETEGTVHTPGRTERTFPRGPLTAATAAAVVANAEGLVTLDASVPLGASGNGEQVYLIGYNGDVELRRDGQRVGTVSGIDPLYGFGLDLAEAGRYDLSVGGSREPLSGPYAFKSFIDWSFDFDPAAVEPGTERELVLPAVAFTAPDVVGGSTPNREQPITLELVDAHGEALEAAAMGLEVSYDGNTWAPVELDADLAAGTATAVLCHPADAKHVSVRMTATDAAGTEVVQKTIAAYGLS
ncbi:hypothetical protein [Glycomyces tritici]|uniref:Ig-like domain repeat protein n=1 Tax=Glycomyces tritici TaxID=2665176 RepID=A0ABT7YV39_9ACTN|nr:hypothetical protein [Glycomyces tritici]MDN3242503.1 hypothetical protein [Glycomyces tritici]